MLRKAIENVNEAKAQFWNILANAKHVVTLNRYLSKAPQLDISFYGKEANINNGYNRKGTMYQYEGLIFATRFTSVDELEVVYFNSDYEAIEYETVKVKKLLKEMKLKMQPYQLMDTAVTTIANTRQDRDGSIVVDFKNGSTAVLINSYDMSNKKNREKMLTIDAKIFKLERYGFKVNKIKNALKVLVPEIYNKRKVNNFTSTESLDEYLEMEMTFGFQDTGGITGEGMDFSKKVDKDKITLKTQAGGSYYGEWTKFNIVLKVPIKKEVVDKKLEDYKTYQQEMAQRYKNYGKGLSDYIKSTGGHHGNPVWMD